jgi:transcriptional regulator with XRE-family HTH domain
LDEVAKAAGISRAYLWEIEAGEAVDPSFRLVASLAKHYGVSLDELAKGV